MSRSFSFDGYRSSARVKVQMPRLARRSRSMASCAPRSRRSRIRCDIVEGMANSLETSACDAPKRAPGLSKLEARMARARSFHSVLDNGFGAPSDRGNAKVEQSSRTAWLSSVKISVLIGNPLRPRCSPAQADTRSRRRPISGRKRSPVKVQRESTMSSTTRTGSGRIAPGTSPECAGDVGKLLRAVLHGLLLRRVTNFLEGRDERQFERSRKSLGKVWHERRTPPGRHGSDPSRKRVRPPVRRNQFDTRSHELVGEPP